MCLFFLLFICLFCFIQMSLFLFSHLVLFYYYFLELCLFSNERQKNSGSGLEKRWGGTQRRRGKMLSEYITWEKVYFPLKEKKNKTIFKCFNSLISQNNKIIVNITTKFFSLIIFHTNTIYHERNMGNTIKLMIKWELSKKVRMSIFNMSWH